MKFTSHVIVITRNYELYAPQKGTEPNKRRLDNRVGWRLHDPG